MRKTPIAAVAAILLAAGCQDRGPSGIPSGVPDVGGRWDYEVHDLTGGGVTCESATGVGAGTVLVLTQTSGDNQFDGRFSGDVQNLDLTCTRAGRTVTLHPADTELLNGTILDGDVTFDFSDPDFLHIGSVDDGSMDGTISTRIDFTESGLIDETIDLVGSWSATKR